jgi:hypothetical protein
MPFVPSPGRGRITVSDFVRDAVLNRLQAVYSANPPLTDTAPSWALRIRPAQHERYSGDGSYDPIQRQSIVDQINATRREALLRQGSRDSLSSLAGSDNCFIERSRTTR